MSPTSPSPLSVVFCSDVNAEIRGRLAESTGAFNRGDIEAILETYAPEAVVVPPTWPAAQGILAIRQLLESLLGMGYCNAAFELDRIECWGELAISLGRYKVQTPVKPGIFETDRGKHVGHWRRAADGQFRITSSVWYSDRWHSANQM